MGQLWITHANQAASAVSMTREEFRRRMDDYINTECQRLANHRRHHGAVNADKYSMLSSKCTNCSNVSDSHPWVRRALQVDESRARGYGLRQSAQVSRVHKGNLDTAMAAVLGQQTMHTSIDIFIGHYLVATFQQSSHCMQGSHARGEGKCCCSLLEHCNVLLQRSPGWIARSRVVVWTELVCGRLDEGGCLIDGRVRRVVWVLRAAIEDDTFGGRLKLIFEACKVRSQWKGREVIVLTLTLILVETDIDKRTLLADDIASFLNEGGTANEILRLIYNTLQIRMRLLFFVEPPNSIFKPPSVHIFIRLLPNSGPAEWLAARHAVGRTFKAANPHCNMKRMSR
mmetsp:Transcript_25337/g.45865  ORF Transcript_25337/g.45865 Transcript_25337/m.45865 type:complete len:342 (+) Transcript_25337:938-1963(+)